MLTILRNDSDTDRIRVVPDWRHDPEKGDRWFGRIEGEGIEPYADENTISDSPAGLVRTCRGLWPDGEPWRPEWEIDPDAYGTVCWDAAVAKAADDDADGWTDPRDIWAQMPATLRELHDRDRINGELADAEDAAQAAADLANFAAHDCARLARNA